MKNESEATENAGFWRKIRQKLHLKPGEKPPRGHALVVKLNSTRSKRARTMDGRQTAQHLYRKPTDENIKKWIKNPGRTDFLKIDNEGRHAGSKQVRVRAPQVPAQITKTQLIQAAMADQMSPGAQDYKFPQGKIEGGRYTWAKVRDRFMNPYQLSFVKDVRELGAYEKQLRDLQTYQRGHMDRLNAKEQAGTLSKEDRQEQLRLKRLETSILSSFDDAYSTRQELEQFRPPAGTPDAVHVPPRNVTLNSANLHALEEMQASEREFGVSVNNIQMPARRHQFGGQQRQGFVAVPMDPGYTYHPWKNADLQVHTHPNRAGTGKLDTVTREVNVPRSILPDHPLEIHMGVRRVRKPPYLQEKVTKRELAKADAKIARAEKEHARALAEFARLNELAKSILYDDSPSGADILNATRQSSPSMIVTPRQNILLVPGRETKPLGVGDRKVTREAEQKISDVIDEADKFAWNRTRAAYPKSVKDAEQRIADYQKKRQVAISSALERKTKLQVHFSDKGEQVKFPGIPETNFPRSGKKTRAQKKREKRGESDQPVGKGGNDPNGKPEKPDPDLSDWDPF